MTKLEEELEAPFWVRFGKEWWPCRYLEQGDVDKAKAGSDVKRLWARKTPAQKVKVVFYGSEQAAIVSAASIKPFQENYFKLAEKAKQNSEVAKALVATRLATCPVQPRVEKNNCMKCHEEWSENDLGPNSDVLICDYCDEEFHFRCTRLLEIPENSWFCFPCRRKFPIIWSQILEEGKTKEMPESPRSESSEPEKKQTAPSQPSESQSNAAPSPSSIAEQKQSKKGRKGGKRKLEKAEEDKEEPDSKLRKTSSSTSSEVMDEAAIRQALQGSYLPRDVAEKSKLEDWLNLAENMWFLRLVAVADRNLKDEDIASKLLTEILSQKEWKTEIPGKAEWNAALAASYAKLKELLQTLHDRPRSLRWVKFKVNEIVEHLLGYFAAKARIVDSVEEDARVATDALVATFEEKNVQLLKDKTECKNVVLKILDDAGLGNEESAKKSKVYKVVRTQLTSDGARWPQKKPKHVSRENVMMACSFYKGVCLFSAELKGEGSKGKDSMKAVQAGTKESNKEKEQSQQEASSSKRTRREPAAKKMMQVSAETSVKTEDHSESMKIKVEAEVSESATKEIIGKEKVRANVKVEIKSEDPGEALLSQVKPEKHMPKKPNLSEQLRAFAEAEKAKVTLAEPASEPAFILVPREKICFPREEEGWFSNMLKERVRTVFKDQDQETPEAEGKGATFCNLFPHCRELDLGAEENEEVIPILEEEHREYAFMQPGPVWWGVLECPLEPCGDSDDDAAPKKKTFGV